MYCLQWLVPVLLIPRPGNAALVQTHSLFLSLYLISFFLERKPCGLCALLFLAALLLLCYSGLPSCVVWPLCAQDELDAQDGQDAPAPPPPPPAR